MYCFQCKGNARITTALKTWLTIKIVVSIRIIAITFFLVLNFDQTKSDISIGGKPLSGQVAIFNSPLPWYQTSELISTNWRMSPAFNKWNHQIPTHFIYVPKQRHDKKNAVLVPLAQPRCLRGTSPLLKIFNWYRAPVRSGTKSFHTCKTILL